MENFGNSKDTMNLFDTNDDDFSQFDPLSSLNRSQTSSTDSNSQSYSNELLNINSFTSNKNQSSEKSFRPNRSAPPPPQNNRRQLKQKNNTTTFNQGFVSYLIDSNDPNSIITSKEKSLDFKKENETVVTTPKSSSFVSYVKEDNHLENATIVNSVDVDDIREKSRTRSKVKNTEKLIQTMMSEREDEFTSTTPFRVFVGTWNVNGRSPPDSVVEWTAVDSQAPDLYVIGFQELDLSKEAFVFSDSSREQEWLSAVQNSLHRTEKYVLIRHVRLVGMMVLVFAFARHKPYISHIESYQVGTGLLGKMGNKGGVGIRFDLHNTKICIVNSHLAAHAELTQKRNEDFHDICSRMRFPDQDREGSLHIYQHDVLIWLGDLNYRIDRMHPDMVKECVRDRDYKPLKENDQLLCQQRDGKAFVDFKEGKIDFWPTYKYNPGTDLWDSSEKARAPAWCDRVLWWEPKSKIKRSLVMKLLEYRSHMSLKISDHKPVSAVFDMNVKVIDDNRYQTIYHEECRKMDRYENNWLPDAKLDKQFLDFGTVKFHERSIQTIEVHNIGKTPCEFEFISKTGDSCYCKKWLLISKPKGYIIAGSKIEIEFEVYINKSVVGDLNSGNDKIEDILILHLINGKDYFISVNGNYLPSCFGTSLEALCRMNRPIRETPQSEILALSKISPMGLGMSILNYPTSSIPKELWQIVDHLYYNALTETNLFQQTGLHSELLAILDQLDSKLPVPGERTLLPGSNHSVAESLLILLETLPEPVIPFSFYSGCLQAANDITIAKKVVNSMSVCHLQTFNYLITFLRELSKNQSRNGLSFHIISTIFSGLLLRPLNRKSGIDARIERQKSKEFLENFLNHQ